MDWRKVAKRLLLPHPAMAGLTLPAALALMLWGVATCGAEHPVTIAAYALAFYGLVILCLRVPAIIRQVQRFRRENPLALRYTGDPQLRMNVSLYAAFAFNAVYAALQLGLGIYHHSAWFYAMAG